MSSSELLKDRNLSDANDLANKKADWLRSSLRSQGYSLALKEMRGDKSQHAYESHRNDLFELYRLEKRN
tara:strand:+ start:272 stop:478 length:207 start_codon:yes stop_codon:yes gene_type:complete